MTTIAVKLYTGDGGNAQRIFIKDAQVGWRAILNDPQRHLGGGVAQYDYMDTLYCDATYWCMKQLNSTQHNHMLKLIRIIIRSLRKPI